MVLPDHDAKQEDTFVHVINVAPSAAKEKDVIAVELDAAAEMFTLPFPLIKTPFTGFWIDTSGGTGVGVPVEVEEVEPEVVVEPVVVEVVPLVDVVPLVEVVPEVVVEGDKVLVTDVVPAVVVD